MNPKISEEDRVKGNLKNILFRNQGVNCCLCLESVRDCFYHLDFTFIPSEADPSTLEKMMRVIFNEQDLSNLTTQYICDVCQERLKQAFIFVAGVRNTSKILNFYIDQLHEQVDTVRDQIESTGNLTNTVLVIQHYIERLDQNDVQKTIFEDVKTKDSIAAEDVSDDDANDFDAYDSIEYEPKSNLLICGICKKSFQYKSALKYHMANMHRGKDCPECPTKPCAHEKYLVAALRKRLQGKKVYKCKDCDYYSSSSITYLISHVNKFHLDLHPHLCDTCGSSFPSIMSHRNHIKQHHSDRGVCEYCDKIIEKNVSLHIESCKKIQRTHQCAECPASFDSLELLKRHDKTHQRVYNCRMCPMTFRHVTALSNHKKTAHPYYKTPRSFKKVTNPKMIKYCEFCQKTFTSTQGLGRHLLAAHKNQKYKCNLCDKEYATRKQYQGHTRSAAHLLKEDPNVDFTYKCTHCNFSCMAKAKLENHINVIHLDVKPYICEICSKSFTTSVHLKNHMDSHDGSIRNYQCTMCDMAFAQRYVLRRHIYRRHERMENWPFSCDFCGRKFVRLGEKNTHLKRVHAEEKTAQCPICGALFYTTGHVRLHVTKVHAKGKHHAKGMGHAVAEFLEANQHNTELIELFRDRRKPRIENASKFTKISNETNAGEFS